MNDSTIYMISNFKKNYYFYKPTRDKHVLGELHASIDSGENPYKRHSLLLKDRKFYTSSFGTDRNKREECPINDWIDERSESFV